MSELSRITGAPHQFTYNGKDYQVKLIDQEIQAQYEQWAFTRAKEAARQMRDMLDKEEYRELLHDLNEDYASGKFAFLSPKGMEQLKTIPGATHLFSLLMDITPTEVLTIVADMPDEMTATLDAVMRDSFPMDHEKAKKRQEARATRDAEVKKGANSQEKRRETSPAS